MGTVVLVVLHHSSKVAGQILKEVGHVQVVFNGVLDGSACSEYKMVYKIKICVGR